MRRRVRGGGGRAAGILGPSSGARGASAPTASPSTHGRRHGRQETGWVDVCVPPRECHPCDETPATRLPTFRSGSSTLAPGAPRRAPREPDYRNRAEEREPAGPTRDVGLDRGSLGGSLWFPSLRRQVKGVLGLGSRQRSPCGVGCGGRRSRKRAVGAKKGSPKTRDCSLGGSAPPPSSQLK